LADQVAGDGAPEEAEVQPTDDRPTANS
jgi:hypothetical protein